MTTSLDAISGYRFPDAELSPSHLYLLPCVIEEIDFLAQSLPRSNWRLFDLGCGNGSTAAVLAERGWELVGVDPSSEGISSARHAYPDLNLNIGSAYDDLAKKYGRFPIVLSLEVVEHLYDPRRYARTLFDLLEPGGTAIISTPYHGYWKNLVMAITGTLDAHFTALWDHGHIKFWSIATLTTLLEEAGLEVIEYKRVGRLPPLAKSMIAIARKPQNFAGSA